MKLPSTPSMCNEKLEGVCVYSRPNKHKGLYVASAAPAPHVMGLPYTFECHPFSPKEGEPSTQNEIKA